MLGFLAPAGQRKRHHRSDTPHHGSVKASPLPSQRNPKPAASGVPAPKEQRQGTSTPPEPQSRRAGSAASKLAATPSPFSSLQPTSMPGRPAAAAAQAPPEELLPVADALEKAPANVRTAMEGVIERCGGLDAASGNVSWTVYLAAPCTEAATGRVMETYTYKDVECAFVDDGKRWLWLDGTLQPPLHSDIDSTWRVGVRELLHLAATGSSNGNYIFGIMKHLGATRIGTGTPSASVQTRIGHERADDGSWRPKVKDMDVLVGEPAEFCGSMEGGKSLSVPALFAVAEHGLWGAVKAPDPGDEEYEENEEQGYAYICEDDGSWPMDLVATFPWGERKHVKEVYQYSSDEVEA